jgi:hypothetical protein
VDFVDGDETNTVPSESIHTILLFPHFVVLKRGINKTKKTMDIS